MTVLPDFETDPFTRRPPLSAGHVIGAYRIEAPLGRGGMGHVYRARAESGAAVAMKIADADAIAHEARVLAALAHPCAPRLHARGGLADGRGWLAMELVSGAPVAGPLAPDAVIALLRQLADALAHAHARGVVHRDLKPAHVLLAADGVRVIDWGIAQHPTSALSGVGDRALGTAEYLAPEEARGDRVDGRCDVYALGVLAYELLTGTPPFVGATQVAVLLQHLHRPPPALAPRCPPAPLRLVALIEAMLEKAPAARPTAAEVMAALDEIAAIPAPLTYADLALERTGPVANQAERERAEPASYALR